ncbi:MAG: DNA repair protein RecN [Actinobacteria bacterium]|nr:DNA repair protein RecN [Actinomycetota bacterium]
MLNLNYRSRVGVAKSAKSKLEEISIRGLGVIDSSNIEFHDGLTVLTGETGAGKTMVLTALGLVLGNKSDSDLVRLGAERATVTGRFSIDKNLAQIIEENGGSVESDCAIITRTVSAQGKSRVLIGGALTSASFVADLGLQLVEIHQQSSSLRLTKANTVRELVDSFGRVSIDKYQELFSQFNELTRRVTELKAQLARRDSEIGELKAFAQAFAEVKPLPGEIELIENEISKLGSVEEINQILVNGLNNIENDEISAINSLLQTKKDLEKLRDKDLSLDLIIDKYVENTLNLQETMGDIASYLSKLEADPKRFDYLQNRKSAINSLIKKYGKGSDKTQTYDQLILEGQSAQMRIDDLSGGEERIGQIQKQLSELFNLMRNEAAQISKSREVTAEKLALAVTNEIRALSMPNGALSIKLNSKDSSNPSNFQSYGLDELEILFCSHQGGKELPLNKVASGGELSRIMLGIEVVIADSQNIGSYIFDEVDAGVGGKAAIEIGRRLSQLAQKAQVIVITHLAQVAVWADHHLVVKKNESGSVTQSDVVAVSENERRVEIARMLSGQESSETAQQHAAELLQVVRESMIS